MYRTWWLGWLCAISHGFRSFQAVFRWAKYVKRPAEESPYLLQQPLLRPIVKDIFYEL
jgi:hypothetical protein